MKKTKSLLFTLFISGGLLGILHLIPISKGMRQKKALDLPTLTEEEQLLGTEPETPIEEKVEVPPIILEEPQPKKEEPKPEPVKEEPAKTPEQPVEELQKVPPAPAKKEEQKEKPKEEPTPKTEEKKPEDAKKNTPPQKESKIGVDRKLVSGIPGTMKYKGNLPGHNVKEKGSITISYTVDANGNVISAHRIDGIRSKNAINNAIYMIRKYVKAEKSKGNSTGTYTIEFK